MICGRCEYESADEVPMGDWDTCPNCDGFYWDMKLPKWTKEKPTEPGFYFASSAEMAWRSTIVLCFLSDGKPKLRYFYPALEKYINSWYGPLQEPGPPSR